MQTVESANSLQLRHAGKVFIGGAWVEPASEQTLSIISPNTEQVIWTCAEAIEADMDRAANAARAAFDTGPWPNLSASQRAEYLHALARALKLREPELARAWTLQVGGLASAAPFMVAGGAMAFAGAISREPAGVVAAIAPWNAPYVIMAGKVAAAMAAGCSVVMKPAPETPMEAYIICEAAEEIGLPAGVLNMVCGGSAASQHLVRHPSVDKVSFTGSTATGKLIAGACAENMTRCSLELGGKSAAILRDDYPVEDAARLLAATITTFSGQVCAMLSRVIAPRRRCDELADALTREMRKIKVGYSDAPDTMMGPLAMARQRDKVERYMALGKEEGAQLMCGGGRASGFDCGYFIEPTLFADVRSNSVIAQEEIFGPVLCLMQCEDDEDAVRIANDSQYGLFGSVLTYDADAAYRIARKVRAGSIAQNGMRLDFSLPFGGFKQSGIGREGGEEGLASFLETKTILLDAAPSMLT
jgi:aldehyde dehydrogenase (NAD+)